MKKKIVFFKPQSESNLYFIERIHPGKIIKTYLELKGITQRDFAEKCEMPFQNMSTFLLGNLNMNIERLYRIELALDAPEGSLMIAMVKYMLYSKPKEMRNINHDDIYDLKTRKYIKKLKH